MTNLDNGGFQARGRAWDPCRPDVVQLLETADHVAIQPIYYGSNHTFLVTADGGEAGKSFAVYKPARGEYPLYDFPAGTLYRREVATWLLDSALGWDLVPPTVISNGRYGEGSLQLFIEALAEGAVEVSQLQRLTLLDVLANNADRKAEHCLLGDDDRLWGIDHGLTFHTQSKLRTVLWHFSGQPIPQETLDDLTRVHSSLKSCDIPQMQHMADLISPQEFAALRSRMARLLDERIFPNPRHKGVPYRW
jgi:hypothetical protein